MKKEINIMQTIIKLFTREEIEKNTGVDFLDNYCGNFCNDVAVFWFVDDPYTTDFDTEEDKKINEYLIHNGANINERVLIDITW